MANPLILLDARVFVAGADLSGYSNEVALDEEAEVKKITTWRSGGAEENKAGIHGCDIKANGLWEAGDLGKPDDAFWAMRRTMDPWSVAPRSDSDLAAGGLMWMIGKAVRTQFQFMGEVGEVAPWEGAAKSSWPLVRGVCAHPSGVPRTATGSGTIVQLGAVPTGKNIYVNLHVLSVAGTGSPTLTVQLQSATTLGFGSPTNRGSAFAAATTIGGQQLRVPGSITDQYWRLSWTISGSSPSFLFLASFGIE
jgi:hypothetical protein